MKGTILYQCRICGHDDILISRVVESVYCPFCLREINLIPSSIQYLKQFFSENGVADPCQNATQTSPVATGCTEGDKNRDG